MKVLFLLDSLAPGGTETSTVALAAPLRDHGVKPTIMVLRDASHSLEPNAVAHDIEVIHSVGSSVWSHIRSVRRQLRDGDYDVIHTALFSADQIGRLAAWRTGVPVVSSFVNTPYESDRLADPSVSSWKVRVLQALDAITARLFVRRFQAVSEGAANANCRALRVPRGRVDICERGRDPQRLGVRSQERRRSTRDALGIDPSVPVVLNLGRLDRQKAQTVLVEAAAGLSTTHDDAVTLIAGKDGSAAPDVRDAIDRLGVDASVRLLGHRTDVGDLLAAADVLAVSSDYEGTAGATVEAMAVGVPIVSTDVAGIAGVLEHGDNALIVPRRDASALASALARVIDDSALADGLRTRGRAEFDERFTLDAATERMVRSYERTLAEHG